MRIRITFGNWIKVRAGGIETLTDWLSLTHIRFANCELLIMSELEVPEIDDAVFTEDEYEDDNEEGVVVENNLKYILD